MVNFTELKKNRGKNSFERLSQAAESLKSKTYDDGDDRFWTLTTDQNGVGSAVIRFLDAPAGEDAPFVRVFNYGWEGPGGWYIENSPSSIGLPDPVYDEPEFKALWKEDKERAKKEVPMRKTKYISNILVISDPKNPETEGKVFLFAYGKKIFEKLMDLMSPEFEDIEPINPFDLWEGLDFNLRCKKKDNFRNYDSSSFAKDPSPIAENDKEIEKIWKAEYSLKEFSSKEYFKSYEDLQRRLHTAMGNIPKMSEALDFKKPASKEDVEKPSINRKSRAKVEEEDDTEDFLSRIKAEIHRTEIIDDDIPF